MLFKDCVSVKGRNVKFEIASELVKLHHNVQGACVEAGVKIEKTQKGNDSTFRQFAVMDCRSLKNVHLS